jgi:hypothetical protein
VLNALQSLAFSAEAQESLSLQVQNGLFANLLNAVAIAPAQDERQLRPNREVMIADEAPSLHLMHANLQRCQASIAES